MSKKVIIGSVITSIIIIAALFGALSYSSTIEGTTIAEANYGAGSTLEGGTGTIASGEIDPNSYSYNTNTGFFESTSMDNTEAKIPAISGYNIFCIEPGGPIRWRDSQISYDEAVAMEGEQHTSSCGCAATPRNGEKTYPLFEPTGTYSLPMTAAYIVSDPNTSAWDGWTVDKQVGLWDLRDHQVAIQNDDGSVSMVDADFGLIQGDKESNTHAGAESPLDDEAVDYGNFDSKVRGKGLQPVNNTDYGEDGAVNVYVDQDRGVYTIGTFVLDYTNGIYGDLTFGGISNMVAYGWNSDGDLVRDDIPIEKFVLIENGIMGGEVTPEYFEPDPSYKTDRTPQVYPAPGEEFYIVINDPNAGLASDDPDRVAYVDIKVDFKYMLANGEYTYLEGYKYQIAYNHDHSYNPHTHTYCADYDSYEDEDGDTHTYCADWETYDHNGCITTCRLDTIDQQDLMSARAIRTIYEQSLIPEGPEPNPPPPPPDDNPPKLQMDLGGIVWEDAVATKENKADGVNNTADNLDRRMKNVKVTLYEEDGTIATLLSKADASGISDEELMHRINPTYTDENGEYLFRGLDPMKKYYVVFEYNGQRYLPTEYLNTDGKQYNSVSEMVNAGLYNTSEWEVTSKGTESETATFAGVEISREDYDDRFSNITAYPENYPSSNSLGRVGSYNATFTQRDLMGYTQDGNGNYSQTQIQLVDGYEFDENGNETTTFKEGEISKRVRDYIKNNKKFPDENAMKQIYSNIAGNDTELWRKLQFIEDCYIQAYSGSPFNQNKDLYPVYNKFKINGETELQDGSVNYDEKTITIAGTSYPVIYPGQFYVNLGLWRRQEFDAAIRKDLFKAAIKINGKTLTYDYDKRTEENEDGTNNGNGQDNNTYWDITVRMSDYDNYYGLGYNRDVYETDYNYGTDLAAGHPGDPLEVYATYQIAVTNQSMSVETQIKEIVDYYDSEYTFKPNLSWVTFQYYRNTSKNITEKYYNMMDEPQSTIDNNSNNLALQYMAYDESDQLIAVTADNANRSSTNKNLGSDYNNLYIHPIDDIKLETGETAYIYLTFQVNKDSSGKIIVDNNDTPKRNIAEINGYATYYRDGTELPNGVTKSSRDVAGLLDRDSNPGNLEANDLQGDRYEKNFEDDTDEAPPLNVTYNPDDVRQVNGTVWEDERTEQAGDALIGNGIRDDGEEDVAGVTVELVEKCTDGSEWIWYTAQTDENGNYNFENFIPGDYIVRFRYGNTDATALSTESLGRTGANIVSYNGQDFKSTTYQDGITQEGTTDLDGKYQAYVDTATQNETGTYGYDIYAADQQTEAGNNYSDAKDIWSRRNEVINYSNNNVTNHVAEVLASPYQVPSYNGTSYTADQMGALYDELIQNTQMVAETGVISMEIEYDRQTTDGYDNVNNNADTSSKDYYTGDNKQNGNYVLANIDFGLEERPKSQLEIDKSVANVRVTLANNNILFDINAEANNALWQDHKEYNIGAVKDDYDGIYPTYYDQDDKHRYSYREEIDTIVRSTDKGLIQLTMDEEIMHGATVQITYAVKITNVGEADYIDGNNKNFYYQGNTEGAHLSTTTTNQVIDYVQNNLRFDESAMNNASNAVNGESEEGTKTNAENGWGVIGVSDIMSQNLVNQNLEQDITNTFINVIQTPNFAEKALVPGESITKMLILSQEITPENTADDLTYANMVEIVKTSNEAGRRMAYSVVGNQDPTLTDASEVDANVAERIVILPPFGEQRIYYLLGITLGAILIGGIILIRRKVLKGKNK